MVGFAGLTVIFFSLTLFSYGSAIPANTNVNGSDGDSSGILRFDITPVLRPVQEQTKREVVSPVEKLNGSLNYMFSITIGGQKVSLSVVTGTGVTWVNPTCEKAGHRDIVKLCSDMPQYIPDASSSSLMSFTRKKIDYDVGSVNITYYYDEMELGGKILPDMAFGVGTSSRDLYLGVAGLGFDRDGIPGFPPLIDAMVTRAAIASRAFSIELGSNSANEGSVIFGGIDIAKYSGPLVKLHMIPIDRIPDEADGYWLYMTSIVISKPNTDPVLFDDLSPDIMGLPVLLDSGNSMLKLPNVLFHDIAKKFPSAVENRQTQTYEVDCLVGKQEQGTLDISFRGITIHIPFSELVWRYNETFCLLAITETSGNHDVVLGQPFFRAAFVVFDQDNRNIHLAAAASCGRELRDIKPGEIGVPSIKGKCPYV